MWGFLLNHPYLTYCRYSIMSIVELLQVWYGTSTLRSLEGKCFDFYLYLKKSEVISYQTNSKNVIDFNYCFRPLQLKYIRTTTDLPEDCNMPN